MKSVFRYSAMKRLHAIGTALVIGAVLGTCSIAQSATRADALKAIAQFHAMVRSHHMPGPGLDTQPPVLTKIKVSGNVTATKGGAHTTVSLSATDNLSGVYAVVIELASADGSQVVVQQQFDTPPSTNYSLSEVMGMPRYDNSNGDFNIYTEPGTWHVEEVDIADLAGNEASYDAQQLASLGKTQFTVTNADYDGTVPLLISGTIDTTTLSLSDPPVGTPAGTPPLAMVATTVEDPATPVASGVDVVSVFFCLPPVTNGNCTDEFGLFALTGKPITSSTTVSPSAEIYSEVNPGQPVQAGTYQLCVVDVEDVDGNVNSLIDTSCGGTANLNSYFPSTTITVTP